ncbi:MAG: radical SAM protein [Deltaproteobacteria bacterium]|nr:MAG: radical SAM protein [Deltaproteobacteria bacterium]
MSERLVRNLQRRLRAESVKSPLPQKIGRPIEVALLYPNGYHLAMSSLGYQSVFQQINEDPDFLCERAFLPDRRDFEEHRRTGTPLLTLERQRPVYDFDVVAFSISYEMDEVNMLTLLDLAGIPLDRRERDSRYPLVVAGGAVVFLNPEPISDFIDLFLVGEAEELLPEFLDVLRAFPPRQSEREMLFDRLQKVPGIYIPSRYTVTYDDTGRIEQRTPIGGAPPKVQRRLVTDIDRRVNASTVFTEETEFSDMHLIEIARGCPWGCRFCTAGFIYLPPRYRDEEKILAEAERAIAAGRKIGLVGPAISDYPTLDELSRKILERGGKLSYSSLRIDSLYPERIGYLKESGQRTVTVAVEAASPRLRDVINKGLSDEAILESVTRILDSGTLNLKIYIMIGLPTEQDDEVAGIVDLTMRIRERLLEAGRKFGRIGRITLSINNFVPKPFTPFQWCPLAPLETLKRRKEIILTGLRRVPNLRLNFESPKESYLQALLSNGDRRLGALLRLVHRFEGNFTQALKAWEHDPCFYVHRQRDPDEILPWDFIEHGIEKRYLFREYLKALKERTTVPCMIPLCHRCGVC